MNKQNIIDCMPIFNAIIEGKNVQIYNTVDLHLHARGWWKTVDNWGFGFADLTNFRIKNEDGSIIYFKEQPENRVHRDLDEYQKYTPKEYLV